VFQRDKGACGIIWIFWEIAGIFQMLKILILRRKDGFMGVSGGQE
jgi:hypothetical protein